MSAILLCLAPYIPPIDPSNASDTQNFDDAFLDMRPTLDEDPEPVTDSEREKTEDEPTDGDVSSAVQTPSGSISSQNGKVNDVAHADATEDAVDVFDGYSYKARQSVNLDDEDEDADHLECNGSGADGDVEESSVLPDADLLGEVHPDSASDVSIKASAQFQQPDPDISKVQSMDEGSKTPRETDGVLAELASTAAEVVAALNTPLPASPEVDYTLTELAPTTVESAAALNTPLPASPTESLRPELLDAEPSSWEGAQEIKPPVRDLVYDPSPPPSVRFDTTTVKSKPSRFGPFKRSGKKRRQKSGVLSFDEGMDLADEETDVPRGKDDDDDWDLIEAPGREETETNGPSSRGGTSLFARGVVDRYRLSVFKKSTPTRSRSCQVANWFVSYSKRTQTALLPRKFKQGRGTSINGVCYSILSRHKALCDHPSRTFFEVEIICVVRGVCRDTWIFGYVRKR